MEDAGKKECGFVLALSFSSIDSLLEMMKRAMNNDKEWNIVGIDSTKKAALDKAVQLVDEEEKKKRAAKISVSEKSRLKILRRLLSEETKNYFLEGGVSE